RPRARAGSTDALVARAGCDSADAGRARARRECADEPARHVRRIELAVAPRTRPGKFGRCRAPARRNRRGRQACDGRPPRSCGHRLVAGAGYVGILSIELHFPDAGSLKGKRKYVKSAKAQLQQRFGASVAEVDHHELWQRARLTVACVSRGHREVEELLDGAERYLASQAYVLASVERALVTLDD